MSAPSYANNDPKGWCGDPSRGAALGRPAICPEDKALSVRLYLRKVKLDSGGYDPNGTYFGQGADLYWFADSEGLTDDVTRAKDRTDAKTIIKASYPNAAFFQ